MEWKYHRLKQAGASKWVSGNNWVTRFDDGGYCAVGVNGERLREYHETDPAETRKMVEEILSQNAKLRCEGTSAPKGKDNL
jgi:hypothetical protein